MTEPRTNKQKEKEAAHRLRECIAGERTCVKHADLYFIGTAQQLHGTQCTCCERRTA